LQTYLGHEQPDSFKYSLLTVLLYAFKSLTIEIRRLTGKLSQQSHLLSIRYLLFQEHFLSLREHQCYQCFDNFSAQVCRWRVQKVLIDICEHASRSLEAVVCGLETRVFMPILVRGMAGEDGGDVEDYGGFLVCEAVLRRRFVGECVEPVFPLGSFVTRPSN
jgi:hypothetical protein